MSKRFLLRLAGFSLAIIGTCGILSSCQKKVGEVLVEKAIEQSTGNKVDISSGGQNITIQSEGQKIEIQGSESGVWPNDLPGEVPRFAWGKIKAVTRAEMPDGKSWVVVCENVPGNIIKNYEVLLKNSGFKTVSTIITSSDGEGGSVSGEKDKLKVALMAGNGSASLSVVREP
ncbi:MAG: hypothetical protein HGA62_04780 [Chlorobiaceae bacterium]|nr:hypothetical protein [Chlorobiaceae bacterium]NTV60753.1 hypothetical protein [Chlorobiaceae bacterium]